MTRRWVRSYNGSGLYAVDKEVGERATMGMDSGEFTRLRANRIFREALPFCNPWVAVGGTHLISAEIV